MFWWAINLPFMPGSSFISLFVPISAFAFGVVGSRLAFRQRPEAQGSTRVGLLVVALLGVLVAVAAALSLLLIFALCGAYWMRTSC